MAIIFDFNDAADRGSARWAEVILRAYVFSASIKTRRSSTVTISAANSSDSGTARKYSS